MFTHNKDNGYTGFLGNRLFQMAATIGLAVKHRQPYVFSISEYTQHFPNLPVLDNVIVKQTKFVDVPEKNFGYEDINLPADGHYHVLGYRQSAKYFSHCVDTIKKTFQFQPDMLSTCQEILQNLREKHAGKQLVSLHVRCGDYLKLKDHHTCLMDTDYYQQAVHRFPEDDTVFVIFSDNVRLAVDHVTPFGVTIQTVPPMSAALDMCLMTLLDAHVIANSSFSWWGAYLAENSKLIIAPPHTKWLGPAYKGEPTIDIILPTWTQIELK